MTYIIFLLCSDLLDDEKYILKKCILLNEQNESDTSFTVSSTVEIIIMQALCWVHDDLNQVDVGSYILKVCGQEEVLQK